MERAMSRNDHDMMAAASGDPDRDFAAMMIPHHQGAINMAEAELMRVAASAAGFTAADFCGTHAGRRIWTKRS